ncbi:Na+/H+ antiporter subunit E [Acinetobacter qingfengensis]|uniref:Pesticidal protein Cry1Ba n=1 Tax=Acinetobacter qingfengensis TaxID=1262585 RepID=A0A1E7RDR3_9GAMM|nr:Na+/H+ antiporter subunit E [Acinetobacter qingfengensis]KAA8733713.1 Na+/H+ antiporter subunit E [Acinetobacter qingfengensis]OEY97471.1 pesticidal protein Cry1Ba [Acinetobacter qingfengensis]
MIKLAVNHFIFKVFPHPLVSGIVVLAWLMLQHSVSSGNLLLALFLGWLIPKLMQNFIVRTPDLNWLAAVKLFFVVLKDIILSNIRVAKLVLGPAHRLHPKWFRVPLDTQHEQVNTLLAMIITTTPGTVSAGIDQQRGDILVHSLDTVDEQAEIDEIKQRYEQPLIQIFHAMKKADREQ